ASAAAVSVVSMAQMIGFFMESVYLNCRYAIWNKPTTISYISYQEYMRIIIITGLSGAGKSVALKTLEDIGCGAVDNVPLSLVPSLIASGGDLAHRLAIGTD